MESKILWQLIRVIYWPPVSTRKEFVNVSWQTENKKGQNVWCSHRSDTNECPHNQCRLRRSSWHLLPYMPCSDRQVFEVLQESGSSHGTETYCFHVTKFDRLHTEGSCIPNKKTRLLLDLMMMVMKH